MARPPVIVSTLCPDCLGDKQILNKKCINCKGNGFVHTELVQMEKKW